MKGRNGFTLIELLVVIAIIALLMSILMPSLSRVKKQAQAIRCRSNLRSWGMLFKFYTDDNDGYFNEGWGYSHHHPGADDRLGLWMNALRPYYKDQWDLMFCPTAVRVVENDADWGTYKAWRRTIPNRYPVTGESSQKEFTSSYGINNWTNYMLQARGQRPVGNFWKSTQGAKNPQAIPVFADSTWHDAWPWEYDQPIQQPLDFHWGSPGTTDEMNHFNIDRHNGWVNFTFMDWSTRTVGLKELWTLKWHRAYNVNGPWTKAGGVIGSDWPQWMRKYKDY